MLSLVEEAARLWLAERSTQERGWVARHDGENWLGRMRAVEVLKLPLVFGRAHNTDITLSEAGAVATKPAASEGGARVTKNVPGDGYRTAASTVVMRSGYHFVQFTVGTNHVGNMMFGVIRPGWDVEGGRGAEEGADHCFYSTLYGIYKPSNKRWEGVQRAEEGDRIGMLLDLDQGSMTVWKNDVKLGVMQAEGLSGPLCWAVSLNAAREPMSTVRIESALLPVGHNNAS